MARLKRKQPSEWFAEQMAATRKARGWTQKDLSDALEDIGWSLGQVGVAKIETGARGMSLDEALLIAAALEVSPLHLFIPRGDGVSQVRLGSIEGAAHFFREWAAGTAPLPDSDADVFHLNVSDRERELNREIGWPKFAHLHGLIGSELADAWASGDTDEMSEAVEALARETERLRDEVAALKRKETRRGR